MTTNLFPFKVLFCFEDAYKLIVEIKRTDIQTEDKSLVYKWLMIQKQKQNKKQNENENENENENTASLKFRSDSEPVADLSTVRKEQITVLSFQSMDQSEGEQIRYFAEGNLTWNADNVSFNGEEMDRIEPEHIDVKWLELIARFLI